MWEKWTMTWAWTGNVGALPMARDKVTMGGEPFVITIHDTVENILARTGDANGTVAFATDTNDIYIYNTASIDRWGTVEDN